MNSAVPAVNLLRCGDATKSSAKLVGCLESSRIRRDFMESGVEFMAVDNPHNKPTIHIRAAVAEHERKAISERTKAALAAAKARAKG
jgi:DNA invertase Pin-like site-specific DNA recombinase